jgi:hypothetical protein
MNKVFPTILAIGLLMLRVIGIACLVVGIGVLGLFAAVFMAMARSGIRS